MREFLPLLMPLYDGVKLKSLQQSFNEEKSKVEKGAKTIQVLQKDFKLSKSARKSAYNSTFLHSDIVEILTGK